MSDPVNLQEKWAEILENENVQPIKDTYRKRVVAQLLENQINYLKESTPSSNTSGVENWNPVLISLIRQAMPNLMAYDVCGVQPMSGPTGLIFAMKARYDNMTGTQALFNEANTGFSASNKETSPALTQTGTNPGVLNDTVPGTYDYHTGMSTADAEALGVGGDNAWQEMSFSIEKVSVTAVSRALKAEYSTELAQDLKAIHNLDAETELTNILTAEILAELNREIMRTVYKIAVPGAQNNVNTAGTFDLDVDSSGRWALERYKTLIFQIERDANAIAQQTRRGRGNILMLPADVASALMLTGMLDYAPALERQTGLTIDDTGNTFAGILMGKYRVYIDPYAANVSNTHFYVVGYKGPYPYDAGLFYCPYVPLQMMRAVSSDDFVPRIGFKTRYGLVANPHVSANGAVTANSNTYYRRVKIANLVQGAA